MGDRTSIAWTDSTFNPWIGCTRVSEGCRNCYAEQLMDVQYGKAKWGPKERRIRTSATYWKAPLRWNRGAALSGKQHLVFCASLADVFEFHLDLPEIRDDLWALIRATPCLTWQLLTKRPENIPGMLPPDWGAGYPNVWLGTSVEDMRVAARVELLLSVPAAVHFMSYEPALGPLDELDITGLDWIIYGGESGPHFRPDNPAWPFRLNLRCQMHGVAFFFKQVAGRKPGMVPDQDVYTRDFPVPRSIGAVA